MNNKSIQGKKVDNFTFIKRIHTLENIIFELKQTLLYYADKDTYKDKIVGYNMYSKIEDDKGENARKILKIHNKSWTDLYKEIDEED